MNRPESCSRYLESIAKTHSRELYGRTWGESLRILWTPPTGWKSFANHMEKEAMLTTERVTEIRTQMDTVFKYKVGAVLRHSAVDEAQISSGRKTKGKDDDKSWHSYAYDSRLRYVVRERLLQECHGGVQLIYVCRHVSSDGSIYPNLIQLAEHELRPFDVDPQLEEAMKPYQGDKA